MLSICSYNVNGVRAALRKGLVPWLEANLPDLLCLQEVRAPLAAVDVSGLAELGYENVGWHEATSRKGYSGVATYSRVPVVGHWVGCGMDKYDCEARVLRTDLACGVSVINVYMPSGTSGEERQRFKMGWLDDFLPYLQDQMLTYPKLLVCGDFNIAHRPQDIHNPKGLAKTSGFLPEERAWLDRIFSEEVGLTDAYRHLHPDAIGQYSWWSSRPGVRDRNLGWRIDYIAVAAPLVGAIQSAAYLSDALHSDHCPIMVRLEV